MPGKSGAPGPLASMVVQPRGHGTRTLTPPHLAARTWLHEVQPSQRVWQQPRRRRCQPCDSTACRETPQRPQHVPAAQLPLHRHRQLRWWHSRRARRRQAHHYVLRRKSRPSYCHCAANRPTHPSHQRVPHLQGTRAIRCPVRQLRRRMACRVVAPRVHPYPLHPTDTATAHRTLHRRPQARGEPQDATAQPQGVSTASAQHPVRLRPDLGGHHRHHRLRQPSLRARRRGNRIRTRRWPATRPGQPKQQRDAVARRRWCHVWSH